MPYFPAVGHIDDSLSPEDVMREYRRRYSLASYHKKREVLVEKLGGQCLVCRSKDSLILVKKDGAPEFRVGQLVNMSEARRDVLLEHCALMCKEHSSEKLYNKGRLTHGTYWSSYKKKCRCEECDEYRANRSLERREDRKFKKIMGIKRPA